MQWLRLWHDMPNDPKWQAIAKRSGQQKSNVLAVYLHMMVAASENDPRGSIENWDDEDIAAALELEAEDVESIRAAMQGKVLDGFKLTGWEKRQPKREDRTAVERKNRERDKQKERDMSRTVTPCHAPDTDTDTDSEKKEPETPSSSGDEAEVYLTRKKRNLTGKRLESFNAFWEAFDYKKSKAEAADAWLDIPALTDRMVQTIIKAAKREAAERPDLIRQGKTPKMAQGWLVSKRWEDEPLTEQEQDEEFKTILPYDWMGGGDAK